MDAKQLKQEILERGIKKSWIADKLKVSNALVTKWLNEEQLIQQKHQIELKKLFN